MAATWIPKRLVDIDLIGLAAADAQAFIAHCENAYEQRVARAAEQILADGQRIVMLSGPSASGKTTTANKLAAAVRERGYAAQVISLDDFYHNQADYPLKENGEKDYENITSLNVPLIQQCLTSILQNGSASMPRFDFKEETRHDGAYELELGEGVLVVEGIHALNPMLTEMLPEGSYARVYAGLREEYGFDGQRALPTRDLRMVRRMVRDFEDRGHSLEKTIAMWPEVCAGEDEYIKVYKPLADILLDTSFSYEICVLAPIVETLAKTLAQNEQTQPFFEVAQIFAHCKQISSKNIPKFSMLREFIRENS